MQPCIHAGLRRHRRDVAAPGAGAVPTPSAADPPRAARAARRDDRSAWWGVPRGSFAAWRRTLEVPRGRGPPLPPKTAAAVASLPQPPGALAPDVSLTQVTVCGKTVSLRDVARFAPLVVFHPEERFFPCAMGHLLAHGRLLGPDGTVWAAPPTPADLAAHAGPKFTVDIGAEATGGEVAPHPRGPEVRAPMYAAVQVPPDGRFVDLNYIFLFAYNGPQVVRVCAPGQRFLCSVPHYAEHYGDVQGITVRVSGDLRRLVAVAYEQHGRRTWVAAAEVPTWQQHPKVRCALHSHATYSGGGAVQHAGHRGKKGAPGWSDEGGSHLMEISQILSEPRRWQFVFTIHLVAPAR